MGTCGTKHDCSCNQTCTDLGSCKLKECFELTPKIEVQNKSHIIKNLSKPQFLIWDYIRKSKNENFKFLYNKSSSVFVPGDSLATTILEMTDEKEKMSKILEFFKTDQSSNEYDNEIICTVIKKRSGVDLTIHFLKDTKETDKSNPTCPIPPEPESNPTNPTCPICPICPNKEK